jgi:hypothetical protein
MRKTVLYSLLLRTLSLLGILALGACSVMPASPIDQAYSASGGNFSLAGGYTRTIFSTNNF